MADFNVIDRINTLCQTRGWSYYRLAKESDIPYSSLNTLLNKNYLPSIPTLTKLCAGFGISLAQFFDLEDDRALLTKQEKECLIRWNRLDKHGQELALVYMQGLADQNNL